MTNECLLTTAVFQNTVKYEGAEKRSPRYHKTVAAIVEKQRR